MIYEKKKLYGDRDDVTLTTYVYSDSIELLNGKKRGAVLICPGGAYLSCSDREAEPVAFRFAAMGYHAFVLRYSTYLEGKKEYPDLRQELPVNEKSIYPNPMRDIAKAWATAQDALVPVEHTICMAKALAQKNIPFEMHVFEEGRHGLSLANQATANNRDQIKPDVGKWVELVEQWLLKRFQLNLAEKSRNL